MQKSLVKAMKSPKKRGILTDYCVGAVSYNKENETLRVNVFPGTKAHYSAALNMTDFHGGSIANDNAITILVHLVRKKKTTCSFSCK